MTAESPRMASLLARRAQLLAAHKSTVLIDRDIKELRCKQLARATFRVRVPAITERKM